MTSVAPSLTCVLDTCLMCGCSVVWLIGRLVGRLSVGWLTVGVCLGGQVFAHTVPAHADLQASEEVPCRARKKGTTRMDVWMGR